MGFIGAFKHFMTQLTAETSFTEKVFEICKQIIVASETSEETCSTELLPRLYSAIKETTNRKIVSEHSTPRDISLYAHRILEKECISLLTSKERHPVFDFPVQYNALPNLTRVYFSARDTSSVGQDGRREFPVHKLTESQLLNVTIEFRRIAREKIHWNISFPGGFFE